MTRSVPPPAPGSPPAPPRRIVVNGRFLTRPPTGVDRMAGEVLRAWDELLEDPAVRARIEVEVVVPRGATLPPNAWRWIATRRVGRLGGHAWEQLELRRAARRGAWLFNPCNTGPVFVRQSLTTIHDAQVFLHPESYSRPFRLWYRLLLPLLGRRGGLVATVSEFSRTMLERHGVVAPGRAHVLANGVDHMGRVAADPDALARFGLERDGYFLALGSLSPHKNLATLLAAAETRQDRSLPLVVAGGGDARVFAGAATGAAPTSGARFLGRIDDAALRTLYENAAALAFPSLSEGFGLPPLEAMSCGCPVLASAAGAVPEVCGDAALYADPGRVGEWAAGLDRLAGDADLRERLRERGRARAAGFRWETSARRLLELIEAAAASEEPAASGRSPSGSRTDLASLTVSAS